jgi:hypothetical protein
MINHFRSQSKASGAVEVDGDLAKHLLDYGHHLSSQINTMASANQKELSHDDQIMCEVEILHIS